MKQYRITSENYVLPGETGDDDAVMHPDDLAQIKKLAGLLETSPVAGGAMTVSGNLNNVPNQTETGIDSPLGSNISFTAKERRDLEREYHANPGTDLWFIINFTKPFLNGSLRDKVEEYLAQHPDQRPRSI
jgi:hypothetical protein